MKEFMDSFMSDVLNGILDEPGYSESLTKTILLLPIRALVCVILLPILAFILVIEALGRW